MDCHTPPLHLSQVDMEQPLAKNNFCDPFPEQAGPPGGEDQVRQEPAPGLLPGVCPLHAPAGGRPGDWGRRRSRVHAGQVLHSGQLPADQSAAERAGQQAAQRPPLLSALYLRRGHGEHPAGVQRLSGHHSAGPPADVRDSIIGGGGGGGVVKSAPPGRTWEVEAAMGREKKELCKIIAFFLFSADS